MSSWQTGIMDKRRLLLLTSPGMMAPIMTAAPTLVHKGVITTLGLYQDGAGTSQVITQAIDSNTDPALAHAQMAAYLAPPYKLGKLLAIQAGNRGTLLAAIKETSKPIEKCARCVERAKISPVQSYGSCIFSDPLDTCISGPYERYYGSSLQNLTGPEQNFLYYKGESDYSNGLGSGTEYRAYPWFSDGNGDSNYPLDSASYSPNLNQTQAWSWPIDPVWHPDSQQLDQAAQINRVAATMGVVGAMWGLGAFIAAGACPVCAGAAIAFALTGALIKFLL